MLGKLLKYDIMTDYKTMSVMYIIMIASSIVLKIMDVLFKNLGETFIGKFISGLLGMIFVVCIIITFVMIFVLSTFRFYKGVVRDEGYLMHTLPVPTWQLIASKMITVYFWSFVTLIFVYLGIAILSGDFLWINLKDINIASDALKVELELNGGNINDLNNIYNMLYYVILGVVISPFMLMSCVFFSFSIGNLFNKHKFGMSVVAFIGIYFIEQIVGMVLVGITFAANPVITTETDNDFQVFEIMNNTLFSSMAVSIALAIIMYAAANVIFTKKLNLE